MAMSVAQTHISAEQSHLNPQLVGQAHSEPLSLEDRFCPGCKRSLVSEQGGLVVAFGQSFFHVDCFKCAKCGHQVTADTNLLLLSDGSPICADCSYSCNVCHQPILDEAIMTGDDSYHAHCFKCKVCKNRIDDLVFAKTTQGIYCMNCHNERMIRIRRHTQKKAEREREKATTAASAANGGFSRSRDSEARKRSSENGIQTSPLLTDRLSQPKGKASESPTQPQRHDTNDVPDLHDRPNGQPSRAPHPNIHTSPLPPSYPATVPATIPQSSPPFVHPPRFDSLSASERSHVTKTPPHPAPVSETDNDSRRNPEDRPLDLLFGKSQAQHAPPKVDGLAAPTTKRDKRNTLYLSHLELSNDPARSASPVLSPLSASFYNLQTTPGGRDSPLPSSNKSIGQQQSSPKSVTGSLRSFSSLRPSSPSPSLPPDRWDVNESRTRSGSSSSYVDPSDDQTVMMIEAPVLNRATSPRVQNFDPSRHPSTAQHFERRGSAPIDSAKGRRSIESRHSGGTEERPGSSPARYRTTSPSHSTDVPDNVSSDDLTDGEDHYPRPPVPPKDTPPHVGVRMNAETPNEEESVTDDAIDALLDRSSESPESTPVERTTRSTFIAPALPPIRFSLNSADFSQLFNTVEGAPPLQALELLAQRADGEDAPVNGALPTVPEHVDGDAKSLTVVPSPPPRRESKGVWSPQAPKRPSAQLGSNPVFSPPSGAVNGVTSNTHNQVHQPSEPITPSKPLNGDNPSDNDVPTKPVIAMSASASMPTSTPPTSNPPTNPANGATYSNSSANTSQVTLTEPGSRVAAPVQSYSPDIVTLRLKEAVGDAKERGAHQLKLDKAFAEAIFDALEVQKRETADLKSKLDGFKRASKQYMDGLTVAQAEYDRELKARRDAEAEVTRLRVLLSGQAAKLMALSGDSRRQELRQQMTREMHDSLSRLEQDLSRLKVERDVVLAEMEELSSSKSSQDVPSSNLSRSLTMRLDNIRSQYQRDLIPLTLQREVFNREIVELKAVRDAFLEETTALNARNEELAQLSVVYARRMDAIPEAAAGNGVPNINGRPSISQLPPATDLGLPRGSIDKPKLFHMQTPQGLNHSQSPPTINEDSPDAKYHRGSKMEVDGPTPTKKFKWPGSKISTKEVFNQTAEKAAAAAAAKGLGGNGVEIKLQHNFQQLGILRFARCDHCGDKMWGSQLKCIACNTSVHLRCIGHVTSHCSRSGHSQREDMQPLPPSMFGRDLSEQIHADARDGDRIVPVIVEKCIDAVEALALDYEGIYRKTGGLGQSKIITQLFERGDYGAFDLRDSDRFNDICSVTSVLKTYFRSLPVPLLTFDLHEEFMKAIHMRDPAIRHNTMIDLVNQMPTEHYHTVRLLMLHLNNVREHSEKNLMNARNLGVVFGPTLMRSRDPGAEFSDMAGKALSIEWLVDNAPEIFKNTPLQHQRPHLPSP